MFPVPETLRFVPGEPTAFPGAPPTPYTVGEVAPESKKQEIISIMMSSLSTRMVKKFKDEYCLTLAGLSLEQ